MAVGFQSPATRLDLVFYAARSYSLMRPPGTGRRLIRFWEVGDGAVRPGRGGVGGLVGGPARDPLRGGRRGGGPAGGGGAGGFDGVAVRCSAARTRLGPAAGVVRRRSASGLGPPSGR